MKSTTLLACLLLPTLVLSQQQNQNAGSNRAAAGDAKIVSAQDVIGSVAAAPTTPATQPTITEQPTQDPIPITQPQQTTTQPQPQTTTTDAPAAATTTADNTQPQQTTTQQQPTTTAANRNNNGNTSSDINNPMTTSNGQPISPTASAASSASDASQPTSAPDNNNDNSGSGKTAVIAGSVVGGLVGVALLAGLLTWCNRRGGCTSRTNRRRENKEQVDDYKMTEAPIGGAVGATAGAAAESPFARRFVPPTSGYMNLGDEEYNQGPYYNQQQGYNQQGYYAADYPANGSHPDYNEYQHSEYNGSQGYPPQHQEYGHQQEYAAGQEYAAAGYFNHPPPGSNVTSPTLTNTGDYRQQQFKPDQIEQKPNAA